MVFSSLIFLFVFLPAVLLAYFAVPQRFRAARNAVLLVFSLFFYLYGEPVGIFIMLGSILANYLLAFGVAHAEGNSRRWILVAAVLLNVGLLGVYKYAGFAVENINRIFHTALASPKIAMPIGISFFTFQGMSYVFDVFQRRCTPQKNILNVATYIALFPQLVAGPIVRYETIAAELSDRSESMDAFAAGCRRMIVGLGKKMLIGNALGEAASAVFSTSPASLSAGSAWLGAIAYALHIYYDFSGYSDMAIGLGQIFGFHFPENFDHPYLSASVTEFWRRWHISLSTWFRDYVYIPLGGNRKGPVRQTLNLLIVWLLTGLWHGAAWNFVLWGLYYAILLIAEKRFLGAFLQKLWKPVRHLYALLAVLFGWVIFNCSGIGQIGGYLGAMFGQGTGIPGDASFLYLLTQYKAELFLAVLFCLPLPKVLRRQYDSRPWMAIACDGLLLAVFGLSVVSITVSSFNPFIYFRF